MTSCEKLYPLSFIGWLCKAASKYTHTCSLLVNSSGKERDLTGSLVLLCTNLGYIELNQSEHAANVTYESMQCNCCFEKIFLYLQTSFLALKFSDGLFIARRKTFTAPDTI